MSAHARNCYLHTPTVQGTTDGPSNIYGRGDTEPIKTIKAALPPNEGRTCSQLSVVKKERSINVMNVITHCSVTIAICRHNYCHLNAGLMRSSHAKTYFQAKVSLEDRFQSSITIYIVDVQIVKITLFALPA